MNLKLVIVNVLLCLFGLLAIYASKELADGSLASKVQLRDVRVESQRLKQAINILEGSEYQELLSSLESSLKELNISIAEFMSDRKLNEGVSDINFQMDVRRETLLPQNKYPIQLLRLIIKYKADNSVVLSEDFFF